MHARTYHPHMHGIVTFLGFARTHNYFRLYATDVAVHIKPIWITHTHIKK